MNKYRLYVPYTARIEGELLVEVYAEDEDEAYAIAAADQGDQLENEWDYVGERKINADGIWTEED